MPQTTGEAALDKLALHRVPGTDLAACLLASTCRRTWCLAPTWPLFASI
jgi:hypothetical protein